MAPAATATTTAAIAAYAAAGTAAMTFVGAVGTAGWFLAGYGKLECPACKKEVRVRDFHEHAKNHEYECTACNESVAFQDIGEHFRNHGYACPACKEFVTFADMEQHVANHGFPCPRCKKAIPFAEMDAHMEIHTAEEDEYSQRRQEVAMVWGFLKAECPICKKSVCVRDLASHSSMHWMQAHAHAMRQEGLANMQARGTRHNRARGLKIPGLVCPTNIYNSQLYLFMVFLKLCINRYCGFDTKFTRAAFSFLVHLDHVLITNVRILAQL